MDSLPSHNQPHSDVRKSKTIIDWPSPLGCGVGQLVIDLTVKDSSEHDEELQWGLTPFET